MYYKKTINYIILKKVNLYYDLDPSLNLYKLQIDK